MEQRAGMLGRKVKNTGLEGIIFWGCEASSGWRWRMRGKDRRRRRRNRRNKRGEEQSWLEKLLRGGNGWLPIRWGCFSPNSPVFILWHIWIFYQGSAASIMPRFNLLQQKSDILWKESVKYLKAVNLFSIHLLSLSWNYSMPSNLRCFLNFKSSLPFNALLSVSTNFLLPF